MPITKLATTTLFIAALTALAPTAHATNGVDGSITSPAPGTVTLSWQVYIPAGRTAACGMSVENSANTTGTYREFDYTAIGGSLNHQGRWVSDSFQAPAPAGSTAYGNVNCTILDPTTGQATVGYWQGSTRVELPVKTIVPTVPPSGGVG